MSQVSRPTRRRSTRLFLVAGLLVLVGAACHPDNTPSSYSAQNYLVQDNFVEGCTGQGGTSTKLAPPAACQCAINWIIANVPYDDANKKTPATIPTTTGDIKQIFTTTYDGQTFKAIDKDLASHPENLPQSIQDGLAGACASKGWKGTASSSGNSGGGGPTTIG
jgi:hypothetical protein